MIDNETSWVILFSAGTGLMIEIWKVKKAMDVHRIPSFPFIQLCYKQTYKTETLKYVCIHVSVCLCIDVCTSIHRHRYFIASWSYIDTYCVCMYIQTHTCT